MAEAHRAGVAAAAFIFMQENNSDFVGRLSKQLPQWPVQAMKVGSLLNFMVLKGLKGAGACAAVTGEYPTAAIANHVGGGRDYAMCVPYVQNSLQNLAIEANLQLAMAVCVGIANDAMTVGVDRVMGAASDTLSRSYETYKKANKAYEYSGKVKSGHENLMKLKNWLAREPGDSIHVFFRAM